MTVSRGLESELASPSRVLGSQASCIMAPRRPPKHTIKNKRQGSNAVRREVNRQIPALKLLANSSHTLRGAWEESGGDPLQWRVAHDKGVTVYNGVCDIGQEGVMALDFNQCDFIDGRLPDAIGELRSLRKISLCACFSLTSLPDALVRLNLLQALDLSDCSSLAALPDAIGSLSALQTLNVSHTSIETLPDSVTQSSSLFLLRAVFCSSLAALPKSLGSLGALKILDLSQCRAIKALPASIGDLENLQELSLGGCQDLTALPDSICGLKVLRLLTVHDCPALSLATAFDKIPGLKVLGGDDIPRILSSLASEFARGNYRIRRKHESRFCRGCHSTVPLNHPRFGCCGACRESYYCSVDCQRKSWEHDHRKACAAFRRRRRRTCDVCGDVAGKDQPPFPVCDGCGARRYCGEACQAADWEAGHKQTCAAPAPLPAIFSGDWPIEVRSRHWASFPWRRFANVEAAALAFPGVAAREIGELVAFPGVSHPAIEARHATTSLTL